MEYTGSDGVSPVRFEAGSAPPNIAGGNLVVVLPAGGPDEIRIEDPDVVPPGAEDLNRVLAEGRVPPLEMSDEPWPAGDDAPPLREPIQ